MSKWETVKLGDVADTCLGKMLDKDKNRGEYQPYLANVNVRWGAFDLDNLPEMKFLDSEQDRYGLKYGDLVICEGGEPGRCAIWKNQLPNMKIQKALHRVRVHEEIDYRYLYYWFLEAGHEGALEQYFTGATIKHMPGDKLKSVIIDKPPIEIQRSIANVLSVYDELIDNNQKQIKLLEEAAQRLYKEWFVDLHFPGYEDSKIVDGVPEGWNNTVLGEIAEFKRGKTITKKDVTDGEVPVVAGGLEPAYYHNKSFTEAPVITVSGSGANAGFARMYYEKIWASDCSYADISSTDYIYFVFCCLRDNKEYLDSLQKGSAQPHVYAKDVNNIPILLPPNEMLAEFDRIAGDFYKNVACAVKKIRLATEARDRLLPRLMSGEIEV